MGEIGVVFARERAHLVWFADEDEISKAFALDLGGGEEGAGVPGFGEDDGAMKDTCTVFQFLSNVTHRNSY